MSAKLKKSRASSSAPSPVSVEHPLMPAESWVFGDYPGATEDHLYGAKYLYELYRKADSRFNGLVTVRVL